MGVTDVRQAVQQVREMVQRASTPSHRFPVVDAAVVESVVATALADDGQLDDAEAEVLVDFYTSADTRPRWNDRSKPFPALEFTSDATRVLYRSFGVVRNRPVAPSLEQRAALVRLGATARAQWQAVQALGALRAHATACCSRHQQTECRASGARDFAAGAASVRSALEASAQSLAAAEAAVAGLAQASVTTRPLTERVLALRARHQELVATQTLVLDFVRRVQLATTPAAESVWMDVLEEVGVADGTCGA